MNARSWSLIALCWLLVGASATELRIMSWNIGRAIGANSPNSAQQPYVAKIANYLKPDIWILHEVGGNTPGWNPLAQEAALISFVQSNLTYYGPNPQPGVNFYVYANRNSDGWISSAIISRYRFVEISDVNIGAPNRGLTIGWIDVPGTNGLGVFAAHFKAGGYTDDAVKRQTNAERTREQVRRWRLNHRRSAYVLGGDLNENEDPDLNSLFDIGGTLPDGRTYAPISTVKSARLRDHMPVDAQNGKRTYRVTTRNSDLRHRFDYLLVSEAEWGRDRINVLEAILFNTRRFPAGTLPPGFDINDSPNASDHAPVFLRVRIDRWEAGSYWGGGGNAPEPSTVIQLLIMTSGGLIYLRIRSFTRRGRRGTGSSGTTP
ncbi:MAG: endonuclease/exonuclease/phosphatase family protein [Armatimonadota bacterium]